MSKYHLISLSSHPQHIVSLQHRSEVMVNVSRCIALLLENTQYLTYNAALFPGDIVPSRYPGIHNSSVFASDYYRDNVPTAIFRSDAKHSVLR